MSAFESGDVKWMRGNRFLIAAAAAPLVAGPLLLAYGLEVPGPGLATPLAYVFGPLIAAAGAIAAAHVWRRQPRPVPTRGALRASAEGVSWNGRLAVPLRSLQAGFVIPSNDWERPPLVRLVRRRLRTPVTLQVPDMAAGHALLRALGLDGSQVVATFTFSSRVRASGHAPLVTWAIILAFFIGPTVLVALLDEPRTLVNGFMALDLLALAVWVALLAMPMRAVVGGDGVLISWLWRRRFIPYASIKAVRPYGAGTAIGVAIRLRSGDWVRLPVKPTMSHEFNQQQLGLVVQRIQQAAASHRSTDGAALSALPGGSRGSVGEWVRSLRAVGAGANVDHRTAPVDADRLWRIVEDPASDPVARGGAAVALGSGLDEAGRARLRVSARATAAPEVRRLLELAAEEASEAEIGAALDRVASVSQ